MAPSSARTPLFRRLFIANRGEVAVRIARACDKLGITPVFAASEADLGAAWLRGREVVALGPGRAQQSYLDPARVVQAAVQSHCSALHPGWGFLSENPLFARLCEQHGVTFIGPPAHVMHVMGRKTEARRAMRRGGLNLIPGSDGPLKDAAEAEEIAERTGYPVLFKAERGGGGRGMRVARNRGEVRTAFDDARAVVLRRRLRWYRLHRSDQPLLHHGGLRLLPGQRHHLLAAQPLLAGPRWRLLPATRNLHRHIRRRLHKPVRKLHG